MTTSIFDEFSALAEGNENALTAISFLQKKAWCDPKYKMQDAEYIWRLISPKCPPGQRYARDSYWGQASRQFVWWGLAGRRPDQKAAWMSANRNRSKVPRFEPIATIPAPTARK